MLRSLELKNIRSYDKGSFEFESGVNIIVGPNASGKTNLLESIHMVCLGSGFKSTDTDMVARGSEWGRLDAVYADDTRIVKIRTAPADKAFVINDLEKKQLRAPYTVPVVLFEPNHMLLLGGEPERRRSYVDGILSQVDPQFKKNLNAYKRTLAQRNRLLKQERVDPDHMFVWDLRLSELSGEVVRKRAEYVSVINDNLITNYRSVSGNDEVLEIYYDSKLTVSSYAQAHLQKLKLDFDLDRTRGFTGSGAHRDDIGVRLDGAEARLSASRGETRSIVLALKMAELDIVRQESTRSPLLLLDDVFSELDGKRRRLLAQALRNTQAFITTTDADAIVKGFLEDYNVIATN